MRNDDDFHAWVEEVPHECLVVFVRGRIDVVSASQLKELLLATVERRAPRTIIDLTQVSSIDSTGLGVLVSAAKRGVLGSLALVCVDETMRNVFDLVGLDRLFTIYTSRRAALAPGPLALIDQE